MWNRLNLKQPHLPPPRGRWKRQQSRHPKAGRLNRCWRPLLVCSPPQINASVRWYLKLYRRFLILSSKVHLPPQQMPSSGNTCVEPFLRGSNLWMHWMPIYLSRSTICRIPAFSTPCSMDWPWYLMVVRPGLSLQPSQCSSSGEVSRKCCAM